MQRPWFIIGVVLLSTSGYAVDKFGSYLELARVKKESIDFRVTVADRKSPIAILAIHGGNIEHFTERLAEAVAGTEHNLYTFEGLSSPGWDMHVTSTHFDDPRAVSLVTQSEHCVSFHGQKGSEEAVCVGGSNPARAQATADALHAAFPKLPIEFPCVRLAGRQPENIGNRCSSGGVQLELSMGLLKNLGADAERLARFAAVVKRSLPTPTAVSPSARAPKSTH